MASLARGEDLTDLPVCFFLAPMDPKRDKHDDVELVLEVVAAGWRTRTGANPMAVPKRRRAAAELADFIVVGSVMTMCQLRRRLDLLLLSGMTS